MRWPLSAALAAAVAVAAAPSAAQQEAAQENSHLVVVEQTPWVVPGGAFAMDVRVDDPPDGAQLRMALHDRVGTRSAFVRSLDGNGLRSRITDRVQVPLDDLGRNDDGSIPLRIVTGTVTGEPIDVELGVDEEGVYPVVVELLDDDDVVVDRLITHLLRLPDPDPDEVPLGTVVVVPLHAPPSHRAPNEIDVAALAQLDVTVDTLLEHPNLTLTLQPTPEAVAAADEADPGAAARLDEVVGQRTVIAGPWVRVDAVAWRQGGLAEELDRQLAAGREAVFDVVGTTPDGNIAVVPPGGGAAAVDAAVDLGAGALLVPEGDLEPIDEDDFPVTLTRPFRVADGDDTVPALMIDAGLAARVGATGDPVLDAHRLLADLAVLALDAPLTDRAAVVVLDDRDAAEAAFLEAFLAGLDQRPRAGAAPLVTTTNVADVLTTVDPAGSAGGADRDDPLVRTVLDGDAPRSVAGLREDLARARQGIASYRSVFGDDDDLAAEAEELLLTAGASTLGDADRRTIVQAGIDELQAELDGLHGPARQRVTLTAREGRVQLVLGNDTTRPADVNLELRGDRLEFPDHPDGRVLVRLDPGTTRVELNLRARSSGDAPLDLRITTPDGRVELGRSRVTVRTTAVSGVGLVLMGAAALFLVVWWTRTILRERGTALRRHPAHVGKASETG